MIKAIIIKKKNVNAELNDKAKSGTLIPHSGKVLVPLFTLLHRI